jgi:hypothetical protein
MKVKVAKRLIFFTLVLTFTLYMTLTDLGFWWSLFLTLPTAPWVGLAYVALIENIITPLNKWFNK